MNSNYHADLQRSREAIEQADAVLIGAGAGLSASAGLTYAGPRFTDNFADFIERYRLTDMYSSGFYPFPTLEEKWAYWSRHIQINRYTPAPSQVYLDLLQWVKDKEHYVLTTNVDGQFEKAGFEQQRIFATQGDYGKFQCANACHDKLYDNEMAITEMVEQQQDCRVPSKLLPICPRCGEGMEPNIRKDADFVEDEHWHKANKDYVKFLQSSDDKYLVLLELGVGFNTPAIIKYPFEKLTNVRPGTTLIRANQEHTSFDSSSQFNCIGFNQDIGLVLGALLD